MARARARKRTRRTRNCSPPNRPAQLCARQDFRKAFALFDEDGTGKVTAKNLRRIARELGETIAEDELDAMIGAAAGRVRALPRRAASQSQPLSPSCARERRYRPPVHGSHSQNPLTTPRTPPRRAEEFDTGGEGAISLESFLEIMRSASA